MLRKILRVVTGCLALGFISANTVVAATITVLPGDASWSNPSVENGNGTGWSAITGVSPRSGNGSVDLHGDRTRFIGLGDWYSSGSRLMPLSDLAAFTFDWSLATDCIGGTRGYTPNLILTIWDDPDGSGSSAPYRTSLYWAGNHNGTLDHTTKGVWYTSGASDLLWDATVGQTVLRTLADWQGVYSANAYISAIGIGVGSGMGAGYHAFADNVTLTLKNGNSTTYNFEMTSPVPDGGATLAFLALTSLGLLSIRRKF